MQEFQIKAQSKKELCAAYQVGLRTLNRWLNRHKEEIGVYEGRAFTPKQVKIIYELIGEPINK